MRKRIEVLIAGSAVTLITNFRIVLNLISSSPNVIEEVSVNGFISHKDLGAVAEENSSIGGRKGTNSSSSAKQYGKKNLAVFYNIFVPEDPEQALGIIEEQINQIAKSYVATPEFNTTIYYVTLARRLSEDYMEKLCRERSRLTCLHLKHYNEGYEEVTLAALHDYCRVHPSERVVYIHAKGKVNDIP